MVFGRLGGALPEPTSDTAFVRGGALREPISDAAFVRGEPPSGLRGGVLRDDVVTVFVPVTEDGVPDVAAGAGPLPDPRGAPGRVGPPRPTPGPGEGPGGEVGPRVCA